MKFNLPDKVEHGGKIRSFSKTGESEILDFSANLNPFPPQMSWKPDISLLSSYPDDRYNTLKSAIARLFQRKVEEISVGNGSVEVIRSFAYAQIRHGTIARIDPPTFGEYAFSVRLAGGECTSKDPNAKVRFVCNPNNPTGELCQKNDLLVILDDAEKKGQILFIDEAFIELSDPGQSLMDFVSPNLFILRSFTKSFSVPGLRFGFGCGDPDLIESMEMIRPPWTVNAFAEDFALHALDHYDELEKSRKQIEIERQWLSGMFSEIGIEYLPSSTNFILLNIHRNASEITGKMLKHNLLVRDCRSFGLPQSIRVAVRTRYENRQLVEALEACLH